MYFSGGIVAYPDVTNMAKMGNFNIISTASPLNNVYRPTPEQDNFRPVIKTNGQNNNPFAGDISLVGEEGTTGEAEIRAGSPQTEQGPQSASPLVSRWKQADPFILQDDETVYDLLKQLLQDKYTNSLTVMLDSSKGLVVKGNYMEKPSQEYMSVLRKPYYGYERDIRPITSLFRKFKDTFRIVEKTNLALDLLEITATRKSASSAIVANDLSQQGQSPSFRLRSGHFGDSPCYYRWH